MVSAPTQWKGDSGLFPVQPRAVIGLANPVLETVSQYDVLPTLSHMAPRRGVVLVSATAIMLFLGFLRGLDEKMEIAFKTETEGLQQFSRRSRA